MKQLYTLKTVASAALLTLTFSTVSGIGNATETPHPGIPSSSNVKLKDQDKILAEERAKALRNGATGIIAQKVVPYRAVNNSKHATATPADYPVGCGLYITEYYRDGSRIDASALTSCNYAVSEIQMATGIARLDSLGPTELTRRDDEAYNTASLAADISYQCQGAETNSFSSSAGGDVLLYDGTAASADAFDDELQNVACG